MESLRKAKNALEIGENIKDGKDDGEKQRTKTGVISDRWRGF